MTDLKELDTQTIVVNLIIATLGLYLALTFNNAVQKSLDSVLPKNDDSIVSVDTVSKLSPHVYVVDKAGHSIVSDNSVGFIDALTRVMEDDHKVHDISINFDNILKLDSSFDIWSTDGHITKIFGVKKLKTKPLK